MEDEVQYNGFGYDTMSDEQYQQFQNFFDQYNRSANEWNNFIYDPLGEYNREYLRRREEERKQAAAYTKLMNKNRGYAMIPGGTAAMTAPMMNQQDATYKAYGKEAGDSISKAYAVTNGIGSAVGLGIGFGGPLVSSVLNSTPAMIYFGAEGLANLPNDVSKIVNRAYNGNFFGTKGGWNPFNEKENAGAAGALLKGMFDASMASGGYRAAKRFGANMPKYASKLGQWSSKYFPEAYNAARDAFYGSNYYRSKVPQTVNLLSVGPTKLSK